MQIDTEIDYNFLTNLLTKKSTDLKKIIQFLEKLKDNITLLEDIELYAILQQNHTDETLNQLLSSSVFNEFNSKPSTNKERIDFIENIINKIQEDCTIENIIQTKSVEDIPLSDEENKTEIENELDIINPTVLNNINELEEENILRQQKFSIKNLEYILDDNLYKSDDLETIQFIFKLNINKIWNQVLNGNLDILNDLNNTTNTNNKLTEFKNLFLKEYQEVSYLKIPENFQYKDTNNELIIPSLMQKLICYRLSKFNRYGNWSGTGSGKTLSAILASRYINAKLTIIIAFNSTVKTWKENILNAFPDSNVITNPKRNNYKFNTNLKNTYILFNYEKYQDESFQNYIINLLNNNIIDFIVLDEIQTVKQREDSILSTRRKLVNKLVIKASEYNQNLKVLGMSATPVINNLSEAKALLEMISGNDFPDLTTTNTINSCISVFKQLTNNGLRYIPKYSDIKLNVKQLEINGHEHIELISSTQKNKSLSEMDIILSPIKLKYLLDNNLITTGTIIYTQFVTNIVHPAINLIKDNTNLKIEKFIGDNSNERDKILTEAKKGNIDVIIGSSPLGTGVDGLQQHFNKIIFLSLPWTTSEYDQIIGRLYRTGYTKDNIDIIIPQVVIGNQPYGEWSYDRDYRLPIIKNKRSIADAAVDGKLPINGNLPKQDKLLNDAKIALNEIIKRMEIGNTNIIQRNKITVPLSEVEYTSAKKQYGEFTYINNSWYNSNSKNLNKKLTENPIEWELYHTYYNELKSNWKVNHLDKIVEFINLNPYWIIADLGCGQDPIRNLVSNKIFSFDHIAINKNVTACDITNIPLENNSVDIIIFSLSLMGTNYNEYFKEANRILKQLGHIIIAEPKNRWKDKINELKLNLSNNKFTIHKEDEDDMFLYFFAMKNI